MAQDVLNAVGGTYAWDVGSNWSAGVPVAGSDVLITTTAGQSSFVTIAGADPAYTVSSLTYTGSSGSTLQSLIDAGSLTVAGRVNVSNGELEAVNGGVLTLNGVTTLGNQGAILAIGFTGGSVVMNTLNGVSSGLSTNYIDVSNGSVTIGAAFGTSNFDVRADGSLSIGTTSGTGFFALSGGRLALGVTGASLGDSLDPLAQSTVDLTRVAYQPGETARLSVASSGPGYSVYKAVLTSASGQPLFTLASIFAGQVTTPPYGPVPPVIALSSDGAGGTLVTIACYAADTAILTADGERPAGELREGDLVLTADGRAEPVVWVGRRSYAGRFLAGQRHLLPVRIRAGALADGVPRRDLLVSPCHAMLIDGALVPAGELLNGVSVVQDMGLERVDYVHIELARHDILVAEGAPSESFVDDGGRGAFHNAADWWRAHPDAVAAEPVYCAPRLMAGPALGAMRRRLVARAGLVARAA